jgi:alkyl sulfatase BDS1-like metallo-beta-lactamase superfamily hydrolase
VRTVGKARSGETSPAIGIAATRGPTVSYISPTDPITKTGSKRDIAGLTFEFLYAPDTEAPEEMHIWIPQLKALTCAENANHSLHNIQTLRGVTFTTRRCAWRTRATHHSRLHHDVRAVFTKELGMWDGDPVSLHPHPPAESARRYVDLIGADQIMAEGGRAIGDEAAKVELRIDFAFTDLDQTWTVWVRRGVLNARRGASPDTQLTVSGPKAALVGAVLQPAAASQLAQAGKIQLDGDESALTTLAGLMDTFDPNFNIVTP